MVLGRGHETQRRIALLAIIAVVSSAWAIALGTNSVPSEATAAAASTGKQPPAKLCPVPRSLRPAFTAAARDSALPPAMLYAVAKVESNLQQDVQSSAGARGLLQVMPATAAALALNIDDPRTNMLAGARYLRQMLDRFGSSDLALAAYNAGPTAVTAAGGAPSGAVLTYVENVNRLWHSAAGCR
jgi:soluble lytic murein transglycosylase-like protein